MVRESMVPHSRFYREPWIQNLLVWKSSDMNFLINCEILIKDDSENTLKYLSEMFRGEFIMGRTEKRSLES
jgi:hypothetical protein